MDKQIELEHLTTAYYLEDRILNLNKELDRLNHNVPEAPKEGLILASCFFLNMFVREKIRHRFIIIYQIFFQFFQHGWCWI